LMVAHMAASKSAAQKNAALFVAHRAIAPEEDVKP
jgi:hypothetical protein